MRRRREKLGSPRPHPRGTAVAAGPAVRLRSPPASPVKRCRGRGGGKRCPGRGGGRAGYGAFLAGPLPLCLRGKFGGGPKGAEALPPAPAEGHSPTRLPAFSLRSSPDAASLLLSPPAASGGGAMGDPAAAWATLCLLSAALAAASSFSSGESSRRALAPSVPRVVGDLRREAELPG